MTNSQPYIREPTPGQLEYLKDLAERTGESFAWPKTFGQASAEIKRLLALSRTSAADRRREDRQVSEDLAMMSGDAAAIRPEEIGGYGAHATMLTSGYDREVKLLEDQIRELHPRRGEDVTCREAYTSCCRELSALSPFSLRRVMRSLGVESAP
jgi:hypothetical protein